MEEIYTVHIKCRPDAAQNYPSERAYSSSTVGGLALTHLIISILGTVLTAALYCTRHIWIGEFINGTSLVSGGLLCAITGILASQRWYIDRNIRWFFVASLLSTICSITSLSLMTFFIVRPTFIQQSLIFYFIGSNRTEDGSNSATNLYSLENNGSTTIESADSELNGLSPEAQSEDIIFQLEIYVHLFLAALVELILSMFSVKIGWKGVKNMASNAMKINGKPIGPDILEAHKNLNFDPKLSHYSNVVKELYKLQKSNMLNDNIITKLANDNHNKLNLPLPESQKEFRERIEKFLAASNNGS